MVESQKIESANRILTELQCCEAACKEYIKVATRQYEYLCKPERAALNRSQLGLKRLLTKEMKEIYR